MNLAAAIDIIVTELRRTRSGFYGDDSPLADLWEEAKDQLQGEPSVYMQAYLDTIRDYVAGFVSELDDSEVSELRAALKCSSREAVESKLFQRLLTRAKKEPIEYTPFEFEYFCYRLLDFTVYGRVLRRTGINECYAQVFSRASPYGEYGSVDCSHIDQIQSREEFDIARTRNWQFTPDPTPLSLPIATTTNVLLATTARTPGESLARHRPPAGECATADREMPRPDARRAARLKTWAWTTAGLSAFLLFAGLGLDTVTTVPGHAEVYLDYRDEKLYLAPQCARGRYGEVLLRGLAITTVDTARRQFKARPDPECRDAGYFTDERGSLTRHLFVQLGLWPEKRARWNADGSWNW